MPCRLQQHAGLLRNLTVSNRVAHPSPRVSGRASSSLANHIANNTVQSYTSTSDDPFLNLSFEHQLLQATPLDSAILFLYINRPCVVIGRNQNPWAEVNLHALAAGIPSRSSHQADVAVDLVRRRSGGGTVFHDQGNVNWTVISPASTFTRDKHVEMVVRALRACGVERARVNERHDIVLDTTNAPARDTDSLDTHTTRFTVPRTAKGEENTVKVSGSAYKLTRGRALHHGTCLLQSPHLGRGGILSQLLHAPGKDFITAKGVESVRSPVTNVGIAPQRFMDAVKRTFGDMYTQSQATMIGEEVTEDFESLCKGMAEMRTLEWTFGQTPQFTFAVDSKSAHRLPEGLALPQGASLLVEAKHAAIQQSKFLLRDGKDISAELHDQNLAGTWTWSEKLHDERRSKNLPTEDVTQIADILDRMLPTPASLGFDSR
ncbi:hypothetical protein FH972_025892 [Carpinus fangiana]|uniref:BPL/LPL catalytic domain-containing protein n=1 Tax=Carpinus fangiana TaxID=176857 RepID=A0A5N6L2L1_9ROSI|nr:hypothetical protein FH972_025892 [Carpinus fangiana]